MIKVASLGLDQRHLGKSLSDMRNHLHEMHEKYGLNICGEGGEYETFTLDCPLFVKKIVIEEKEVIIHSNDAFAPVAFLKLKSLKLQDKNVKNHQENGHLKWKSPNDFVSFDATKVVTFGEVNEGKFMNNLPKTLELSLMSPKLKKIGQWFYTSTITSSKTTPNEATRYGQ